jgi:hypothetical protein
MCVHQEGKCEYKGRVDFATPFFATVFRPYNANHHYQFRQLQRDLEMIRAYGSSEYSSCANLVSVLGL